MKKFILGLVSASLLTLLSLDALRIDVRLPNRKYIYTCFKKLPVEKFKEAFESIEGCLLNRLEGEFNSTFEKAEIALQIQYNKHFLDPETGYNTPNSRGFAIATTEADIERIVRNDLGRFGNCVHSMILWLHNIDEEDEASLETARNQIKEALAAYPDTNEPEETRAEPAEPLDDHLALRVDLGVERIFVPSAAAQALFPPRQ